MAAGRWGLPSAAELEARGFAPGEELVVQLPDFDAEEEEEEEELARVRAQGAAQGTPQRHLCWSLVMCAICASRVASAVGGQRRNRQLCRPRREDNDQW